MKHFQNEYEYLVHLLRCALRDQQPRELPEGLSFQKVLTCGKDHEVANLAFLSVEKLARKPEEEVYKAWKSLHGLSIRRHAHQMAAHQAIVAALDAAGIRHMELQGTLLKPLYPQPYLRMMSDIDFIIDKENLDAAQALMNELGYKTKNPNGIEVDAVNKDGIFVELHSSFFAPTSKCYGTITDPFSYARPTEGCTWEGSTTIFYLYALLHCVKHYLQRGAGIRRIMDLYILQTKVWPHTDQAYIQKVLSESGYDAAACQLLAVAEKWFADAEPAEDLSETEALIFEANNHGTYQVSLKNEYKKSPMKSRQLFKLKTYCDLLFPPKADIYKAYPRCARWKLPAPLCWVYRWFAALFDRKKRANAIFLLSRIAKARLK